MPFLTMEVVYVVKMIHSSDCGSYSLGEPCCDALIEFLLEEE